MLRAGPVLWRGNETEVLESGHRTYLSTNSHTRQVNCQHQTGTCDIRQQQRCELPSEKHDSVTAQLTRLARIAGRAVHEAMGKSFRRHVSRATGRRRHACMNKASKPIVITRAKPSLYRISGPPEKTDVPEDVPGDKIVAPPMRSGQLTLGLESHLWTATLPCIYDYLVGPQSMPLSHAGA